MKKYLNLSLNILWKGTVIISVFFVNVLILGNLLHIQDLWDGLVGSIALTVIVVFLYNKISK